MIPTLSAIARYPVKGLGPDFLSSVALTPQEGIPDDRRYALADTAAAALTQPRWLDPDLLATLSRCPRLALLETAWDETTQTLFIRRNGREVARASLATAIGRARLSDFFSAYLKGELRAAPLILEAPGVVFSDSADKHLTLLSASSLNDLTRIVGAPVDPRRFRANLLIDGLPPWQEFNWIGSVVALGSVRLRATRRAACCPACSVDPLSGAVDVNMPHLLEKGLGHADFGICLQVETAGTIAVGDALSLD